MVHIIDELLAAADRTSSSEVRDRAGRMISHQKPRALGVPGSSIQFLRGVGSRASFALSSFYILIATSSDGSKRCTVPGYPGQVLQSQLHFSSRSTIALSCRKAFDHGRGLTGAAFGRIPDSALDEHAKYWSKHGKTYDDASSALRFLRSLFSICSKKPDALFKDGNLLGCRIGFLKQYADREAAHLSLDDYEFDIMDVAHVVAALTLIGSIISSFDDGRPSDYFNSIDEAAFKAATELFPETPRIRLFEHMRVDMQARLSWQWGHQQGLDMFMEGLPLATGWN